MGQITIDLETPIAIGEDKKIARVVLREPRMRELLAFGKPFRWVTMAGKPQYVEDDDAIKAYLEKLVEEPDIPTLLGNVSLADGLRIREAFLGFFAKSEATAAIAAAKPTTSSD
ncbi:hypothetical protein EYW49_20560 [Siculibacillus lacustris]|uniref:Phage tail assembly protein n=1 Tax=Siculibacillus lacustris TaxID=1549641 RepID=A0A4Q9VEU9_9HYPH|nr:hypothetical protein [Siculibacillus lacustris]TBW33354.1 hypothetical protein EYW49_20560 [Siculibacillus lacustris]